MSHGTLYGLGLGPGDPELITLKALRVLERVPILLAPSRSADQASYALRIAAPYLDERRHQIVRLPFSDERDGSDFDQQWDQHATSVLKLLADGRSAAFLTEGDPLLYSSFVQLSQRLRALAPELAIEVVPGVSSLTAAAAAAGEPLTARNERLAVLPAVYDPAALERALAEFDTVVLLKVHRVLPRIVARLEALGLAERAVLVERCGRPEQRIVRGLRSQGLAPADYFSLLIVRR
jgi:precorrin-2/cobalt-factor-2 C20-methyltransferase